MYIQIRFKIEAFFVGKYVFSISVPIPCAMKNSIIPGSQKIGKIVQGRLRVGVGYARASIMECIIPLYIFHKKKDEMRKTRKQKESSSELAKGFRKVEEEQIT
jgi:hypothetical protein